MKIGIIGAGISGLASAKRAKELGIEFKVFDGRDTVGGRLFNKDLADGSIIELGGQWYNHNHHEVQKLVTKYNLMSFPTPVKADLSHLFIREAAKGLDRQKFDKVVKELCSMADELDLNDIMSHPNAKEWDAIDFNECIYFMTKDRLMCESINVLMNWHFSNLQVDNTSLLNVLFFIKSNHATKYIAEFSAGLNEQRIVGGLVLLAQKLARDIGHENIVLNSKVSKVEQANNKVYLHVNGERHEFDDVIIAIAPEMAKSIEFSPPLPQKNKDLLESYIKTKVYKFSFTYKKKFWEGHGFALKTDGFISKSIENTTLINRDFVYVGFVIGTKLDVLLQKNSEERKQILSNEIKEYFANDEALNFEDFSEYDWDDKIFKEGYFISKLGVNGWNRFADVWAKPVGNIHFSGTENSKQFNGYVEGAVIRGYEVVDEIAVKKTK